MKTNILIIIGILTVSGIVALTIGTLEYQTEYNQNCHNDNGKVTGFLKCTLIHEDFALPNPFTVGIPFDQTFQYEDLELYFYDIEDSRCPTDVTCIWEGEVTAMIHVRNQTHKTAGFFTPGHTISYITPYNVTLVDIQPHPISTEKPDYTATLEITKLDDEKITDADNSGCDEGFKNIDGVCKELGKIREKDIPVFFEIQLMELGMKWELADRSWANPDFEIEPPARICSHIIKESGEELYISTIWQDKYSLSDMIIQKDIPDDCVKFFPVTQIGRK